MKWETVANDVVRKTRGKIVKRKKNDEKMGRTQGNTKPKKYQS